MTGREDKNRYRILLTELLAIAQKEQEISAHYREIRQNILVAEVTMDSFNKIAACDALQEILKTTEVKLRESTYVKYALEYRDVDISLHEKGEELGRAALIQLLGKIDKGRILQ